MDRFDYIVVGAGSAGAVVAARLSENPDNNVLLLEAGGAGSSIWVDVPLGVGRLLTNPRFVWQYATEIGQGPVNRPVYWPKGRGLGGSSAVNGMVYVRGSRESWNEWSVLGNEGWAYDEVLPYFRKLEDRVGGDPAYRGIGGPISISDVAHDSAVTDAFVGACNELGAPKKDDYNGPDDAGVAYLQFSMRNGKRRSTAVGYLQPATGRKNLAVLTHAVSDKLLFDGYRCIGVEYLKNRRRCQARAECEIVLCAGSVESPAILERSGIGDPRVHSRIGVSTLVSRKEVGENLQDHYQVRMSYEIEGERTVNDILASPVAGVLEGARYLFLRRGLLATSTVTAHSIMRSNTESEHADTKVQIALVSGKDRYSAGGEGIDLVSGITLGAFQIRPESRGRIHAASKDPLVPPKIDANYLAHPIDRERTIAGLRLIRRIACHAAMRRFIKREILPGRVLQSDVDLLEYAGKTGESSWHPIGTCRMGADAEAVVDPELRVRGVDGLRIADASIMPTMVSTNTNAPCIMIGEKAADMIQQSH